MTVITDLRTRILLQLGDPLVTRFTNNQVDEGLRLALSEYNAAYPQLLNSTITVTVAGKTQALTNLTNLIAVQRLIYPYVDENSSQIPSFYCYFAAGIPQIEFTSYKSSSNNTPQAGEKFKVFYSARHTISGLDGAASTTVISSHESILVEGAAGYTSQIRASVMAESLASSVDGLIKQSTFFLSSFRNSLLMLRLELAYPLPTTSFDLDA